MRSFTHKRAIGVDEEQVFWLLENHYNFNDRYIVKPIGYYY